jgi:hypothetical protein
MPEGQTEACNYLKASRAQHEKGHQPGGNAMFGSSLAATAWLTIPSHSAEIWLLRAHETKLEHIAEKNPVMTFRDPFNRSSFIGASERNPDANAIR